MRSSPLACVSAQSPILELRTEGNTRLSAPAVIAASGLKPGALTTRAELDNAAKALFDTGLFQSVNYRYQAKSSGEATGWIVAFLLTEAPADGTAILDILGLDSERLWEALHSAHPLIGKARPQNERAVTYYRQAPESVLVQTGRKDAVTTKTEADLVSGRMARVFRSGSGTAGFHTRSLGPPVATRRSSRVASDGKARATGVP